MKTLILIAALASCGYPQAPQNFEDTVRAAMAPSLARQRASIQKQAAAIARTSAPASDSGFFTTAFPPSTDCDPVPSEELDTLVKDAAGKEGVAPELVHAVIQKESAARPCAISYRGAQGLMQLMPATAEQFEVSDAFDPRQNVQAGTRLLKLLLNRYDNDVALALGAYNAGAARVDREGGVPAIPETQNYVFDILSKLK